MTNEEAIAIITEAIEDYVCNHVTDTAKAQKMLNAIQTLEQEPCEDAISRQAVLDLVADYDLSMGQVVRGIHALPSVKPQESYDFAKWVATEIFDEWEYNKDAFAEIACRKLEKLGIVGAKGDEWELVEPQERSE